MAVGDVTSNEVGSGARYNSGKVRYELIPTHLLESTARVLDYGTMKYAEWNWAKGMDYSVPIGCMKRHLAAIERGEDIDPESGERHIGHVIANALMLEHYMNVYPQMDDRPKWFKNGETNEGPITQAVGDGGSGKVYPEPPLPDTKYSFRGTYGELCKRIERCY